MWLLLRRSVIENKLRRNVNIYFLRYSVSIEPHSCLKPRRTHLLGVTSFDVTKPEICQWMT